MCVSLVSGEPAASLSRRSGQAFARPNVYERGGPLSGRASSWSDAPHRRFDPTYKFLRVTPSAFRPDGKLPEHDDDIIASGGARIRCPACLWQPDRQSRWFCIAMGAPENFSAGCGHGWQTFDTGGICPGCLYQWRHTTCLSCNVTSRHDDWYDKGGGAKVP